MRKKYTVLFFCLSAFFTSYSQCGNYSQLLNAALKITRFFDADHGIAFGHGTMIATSDGGANWHFIKFPNGPVYYDENLLSIDMIDGNSAIIVGHHGTILKTTDKGQTWTHIPLGINGNENINSVDFVNANIGYLTAYTFDQNGNSEAYFMKSIDGGQTWTRIITSLSGINSFDYVGVHFLDETIGFVWSGHYFLRTVDGGLTWNQIQYPQGTDFNSFGVNSIKLPPMARLLFAIIPIPTVFTNRSILELPGQRLRPLPRKMIPIHSVRFSTSLVIKWY